MRRELELKFKERWPDWFRHLYGDYRVSCLYLGFTHGDGWFDLVWQLCEQIEPIVLAEPGPESFEVYQVKEKFGGLRFYNNHPSDRIEQLCEEAGERSFHICEICGGPGFPYARCEQHRSTQLILRTFDNPPPSTPNQMLEIKTESGSTYHIDLSLKTWERVEAPQITGGFPLRTKTGTYDYIEIGIDKPMTIRAEPLEQNADFRLIKTSKVVSVEVISEPAATQ